MVLLLRKNQVVEDHLAKGNAVLELKPAALTPISLTTEVEGKIDIWMVRFAVKPIKPPCGKTITQGMRFFEKLLDSVGDKRQA